MECTVGWHPCKTPHLNPWNRQPPSGMTFPGRAWVRPNCVRTSVRRFQSCLYKWGMVSSVACECDAEEQTIDNVVLQYPIHQPRHVLHGLTVLDDEIIEWLLNICPEIQCVQSMVWWICSKEEHPKNDFNLLMEWLQTLSANALTYWKDSCECSVETTGYNKVVVWHTTNETTDYNLLV